MGNTFNRRDFLRVAGGTAAGAALFGAAGCGSSGGSGSGGGGKVTLRLSHQWPKPSGGKGDFRALLADQFADKVSKATDGEVTIRVYPSASLVKPDQQYKALQQGTIDASVFPLDYASGIVPAYDITLMPAIIKNHEEARKWKDAEIGKRIDDLTQKNGARILTWIWNAGAIGVRKGPPVVSPDDVSHGQVARAAGTRVEQMLKRAGYSITSMSSSEIYSAMQTGVLDVAVTSTGSFRSYRIYEQTSSYTSPFKGNTFWFMFEPLIIGTDQLEQLSDDQQKAVIKAGQELQEFGYTESEADDEKTEKAFKDAGNTIAHMDDAAHEKWQQISKPVWDNFASGVDGGQELIDLAQKV
ncbi:MAG TPA: TRAP transporter substrate-binding protein DctP [Segeticoccus sp.]|nr:TRAP transporter substrate-binding protein DctP [Segeticoccus sp.]